MLNSFCVISSLFYSFMTATSFFRGEEESELFPWGSIFRHIKKVNLSRSVSCCYASIARSAPILLVQSPFSDVPNRALVSCREYYRTCSSMPVLERGEDINLLHLADRPGEVVAGCH